MKVTILHTFCRFQEAVDIQLPPGLQALNRRKKKSEESSGVGLDVLAYLSLKK